MKKLFQSNIGRTGRVIRALVGLMLLGVAVWIYRVHWLACAGLAMAGAFCLFEASRGWCLARACGIRTKW
jgi:thiol:disulfide interchange protein